MIPGITEVNFPSYATLNQATISFEEMGEKGKWKIYIPKFSYTTDNAAMIAMVGHYKLLDRDFCPLDKPVFTRTTI